jgi:phosphotransferase system  glucose/maltose/N-acetylglucosamine-specific IIC component
MVRVFLYLDLVTLLMSMHGIHIADTLMEWALKVDMLIKFRNHHVWIICLVIFLLTFFLLNFVWDKTCFREQFKCSK